jgi:hypothetical protein
MGDDKEKDILGAGKDDSSDEIVKPGLITPKEKEIITSPDDDPFHKSIYDEDAEAPLGVVKRDPRPDEMEDILDFVGTETGLMYGVLDYSVLDKFAPPGVEWEWEDYQLRHLDCSTNYVSNKARQVGMSASFAAKAFARGILTQNRNYTAIFTSYKKEEAVNKVKYVKQFLSALPLQFQKKILRDPQQLIEWENRDGTKCKIISHAQRPIRGAHGDIFLDELAFYQFAEIIYESAFAATQMMGGTIDITSTPFGKFGKFYEIVANSEQFPDYSRDWIYWWDCSRYLKHPTDEFLAYASQKARKMFDEDSEAVEERVYEFGNEKLKRLYRNSNSVESFRQELEGFFVDEQGVRHTDGIERHDQQREKQRDGRHPEHPPTFSHVTGSVPEGMITLVTPGRKCVRISYPVIDRQGNAESLIAIRITIRLRPPRYRYGRHEKRARRDMNTSRYAISSTRRRSVEVYTVRERWESAHRPV